MKNKYLALALLALLLLPSFSNAACGGAGYEARLSGGWYWCKDLKIYNNDSNNGMVSNTTVLFNFDHAALVTAGKSYDNASDIIFTRNGVEIDAINLTPWNTANVLVGFRTNDTIARSSSDTINYALLYGGEGWTVPNRYRNASRAFTWADDFTRATRGTVLNDTGAWWQNSATYSAYQLEPGTMTFHPNGGWWNVLAQDRWAFPSGLSQYNTSIVGRFRNETGFAASAIQYIGGRCGTNNTVNCGAGSEMAWYFDATAGATVRLRYGINTGGSTAISPVENKWYLTDMRFGPNSTPTQFWRSSGNLTTLSTNPGNVSTVSNGTWYPAIGTDGSGNVVNFTYDFLGVRYYSTVVDPTVNFGAEETLDNPVVIYYPSAVPTTYYNLTTFNVIYHLNSTTNATSMRVWKAVNGVTQNVGYLANGTTNTTTAVGFNSGYNVLTMTALITATNSTSTINVSVYNGLNFTVYNASQPPTTYLSTINLTVWNATNSTSVITGTTPHTFETRSIPNTATVNINATKSGYEPRSFTSFVYSNTSAFYAFEIPLWRTQELKATSSNGTAITTFSIQTCLAGNCSSQSTTNGSIYFSLGSLPTGDHTTQFTATGYNVTNVTINYNTTSEVNYTLTLYPAGIQIFAYDENSCALGSCTRLYLSYQASNTTNTTQYYDGGVASCGGTGTSGCYFFNLSYAQIPSGALTTIINNTINGTYASRTYYLTNTPTSALILYAYLLNYSLSTYQYSTFCTITASNSAIPGATITIQRSIAGSYVTVAQLYTGTDGCSSVGLDSTATYQIVASATGYTSYTFTTQPKTIQYIVLSSAATTQGFQTSYADTEDYVLSKMLPSTTSVLDSSVTVNYTVYSYNSTLSSFGMLCDYNGTTIYNVNVSGSPSGGSVTSTIGVSNKTNSFFCYGYFDRTGYNTTYLNRTYYLYSFNTTFINTSISQAVNQTLNGNFSKETLTLAAIVLTTIGTAGITQLSANVGAPLGAGIVSVALISGFGFFGWIDPLLMLLYWAVALAFAYFNSRQF